MSETVTIDVNGTVALRGGTTLTAQLSFDDASGSQVGFSGTLAGGSDPDFSSSMFEGNFFVPAAQLGAANFTLTFKNVPGEDSQVTVIFTNPTTGQALGTVTQGVSFNNFSNVSGSGSFTLQS